MASPSPAPLTAVAAATTTHIAGSRTESRPWLAAATGALVLLVLAFHQLGQPDLTSVYRDPIVRLTTLGAVLMGVALLAARRFELVPASTRVALTLGFEVVVAFWIAMVETAAPLAPDLPVRGLSAVGPWIVFASLMRPAPVSWTLVAGLVAASTWPLAYAINVTRFGFPIVPWDRLIVWPAINYLMALLAWLFGQRLAGLVSRSSAGGLGSYRLLAPIGAGGMGEVWKATHEMLARKAAIKLVRPRNPAMSARQAETWVKRFQREANVIAGLQSPNTIYLYDFGVSPDGQFYYAMELLDGVSLETLVASFGPQAPARVRSILLQACASLEEAHQQGLVHRDLKPSNIMLCKLALEYDFVKVLDFGLAKCAACEEVSQISMEGVTMGTPAYIAPEVAMAESSVDGRADLYSLGCVAYYLLTGALVFPDPNPMTMALKHVQEKPVPPSARTELRIPADLEAIVMQCLEKRAADRPPSARQLAARLVAADVPAWTPADAALWWDRHLPPTSSLRSINAELQPSTAADPSTRTAV